MQCLFRVKNFVIELVCGCVYVRRNFAAKYNQFVAIGTFGGNYTRGKVGNRQFVRDKVYRNVVVCVIFVCDDVVV